MESFKNFPNILSSFLTGGTIIPVKNKENEEELFRKMLLGEK